MNKKSQAALEYLSTYVWAFVAISVTLGALYYFGILDFGKYLPQECIFTSQFKCLDFSLNSNPSEVRLKLVNNLGEDITVTSLAITNDANPPISCTLANPAATPFDWMPSSQKDIVFGSCSRGAYLGGGRVELKITMQYYAINTLSHPSHTVNGKINGRVR